MFSGVIIELFITMRTDVQPMGRHATIVTHVIMLTTVEFYQSVHLDVSLEL